MPTLEMQIVLPLALRALAVLCAAAAGWSLGRSVPSWEADKATDHFDLDVLGDDRFAGRGWGWGGANWGWAFGYHAFGAHPGGCLRLGACGCAGCLGALGQFLHGGFPATLCLVAAVVATYYAWPWVAMAEERHSWLIALVATPGVWMLLAGVVGGWILAVTTDKGPVGPLE